MTETFDRSQLDGKDREQLSAIASALGLKSISRLKKAELIDAIVGAAGSSNGASEAKPRRIRSTKPAADDLDALAAEQDALAASGTANGGGMTAEGDAPAFALVRACFERSFDRIPVVHGKESR